MSKKQNTSLYQGTALVIAEMTDAARFQTLGDRLLVAQWQYELRPRGLSEHGTVTGQPDSWAYDSKGRLCAIQYGICKRGEWPEKLEQDLKDVKAIKDFSPEVFVFCTNCSIDAKKERAWIAKIKAEYQWELHIIGLIDLANVLDTTQQGIRKDVLGIAVEKHNWDSLLSACKEQRQKQIAQYAGKYDPSVYVPRDAEQKVRAWYRQMIISLHQEKLQAQRLAIVDQAGAGKTNMMLHLAEAFGSQAPVMLLPGNIIITDRHTLEREIVEQVGYPVDDRTYHAELHELCRLAQSKGFPFLVILDGVDENSEPGKLRAAIDYLWSVCQNYSFLLLITCRDAFWSLLEPSSWKNLPGKQPYGKDVIPLGRYSDDEFKQACKCYFAKYNLHVTLEYGAAQRLRSPLLLRIFAEGNQNSTPGLVRSIADADLWKTYVEMKIEAVYEAMERSVRKEAIRDIIEKIALRMVKENTSTLGLEDLAHIHSMLHPYDASPRSLLLQLKNAAVLFEDAAGSVKFVHETLLEFIIGLALSRTFEAAQEHTGILAQIDDLASKYRWRQVPRYIAENVSQPATIIERLCATNIWLAATVVQQLQSLVPLDVQARVIAQLEEQLLSKFTLDRDRAARFLGLLGATGSQEAVLRYWRSSASEAALCSLARLGVEEVVEPFIHYLGTYASWYLPERQELVNALPPLFRQRLIQTSLAELNSEPEYAFGAAHTLGYLKYEQATDALFTYLVRTEYCESLALWALLRMQTEAAFKVVEVAVSELGKRLDLTDQQSIATPDNQAAAPTRNHLYMALDSIRTGVHYCSLEKITPFLTRLLSHPNEYVKRMAVRSLGQLGAGEAILPIIQSQQSETKNSSMGLMETLREFGPQIQAEPLIALADDPATPDHVLQYVISALGASQDRRALGIFKRFIKQPKFLTHTVLALGDSSLPEAVPLLVQVLESKRIKLPVYGLKDRDALDNIIIDMLGKLQYPSAFQAIEKFAKQKLPAVWVITIHALAATGGEKAIPFLRQVWELDAENQQYIIQALLWIGTSTAADVIKELLTPYTPEKAILLAKVLHRGRSLLLSGTITRFSMIYDWIDDQLIAMLDTYVDGMSAEDKLTVIFALEYIAVPSARRLLERIASDPQYDIPRPSSPSQTLRGVAVLVLCNVGSDMAIDCFLTALLIRIWPFLNSFLLSWNKNG